MKKLGLIKNSEKTLFPLITTRPRTMTFADYQLLTTEQKQGEIVVTDYPVPDEGDYVEVTADGEKTWATLLGELYSKIDKNKIVLDSFVELINVNGDIKYPVYRFTDNAIYCAYAKTSDTYLYSETLEINSSASKLYVYYQGSGNDWSNHPISAGKLRFYYNSVKTLELGTLAENCMMPDGVTSVETKLNSIFTPRILLTSNNDLNAIITPGTYYSEGTNNPTNAPGYNNILIVMRQYSMSTRYVQIDYSFNDNKIYVRRTGDSGATWTAWSQL